jgi:hypothetical protein
MKIILKKDENTDKAIVSALNSANGKAIGHAFTSAHEIHKLAEIAEGRLEALRLPKKYRAGACFVAVSGEAVPNKYKYTRIATMVKLERGPKCWFLIAAERAEIHQSGGWRRLHITKEQDKAAVELMRVEYDVI